MQYKSVSSIPQEGSLLSNVPSRPAPLKTRRRFQHAISMVLALVMGLVLSLAHHFLYNFMDGRSIHSIIRQAWLIRIGTAMAFVAKMSFILATSIAYTQRQWRVMGSTPFRVSQVDSLTSIMHNALCFFDWGVWRTNPLLASMAIVRWILPLSIIITPGTISVIMVSSQNTTMVAVPQLLYNASRFGDWSALGNDAESLVPYFVPNTQVYRVANTAAASHEILDIPSRFTNSSYDLDFHGPALKCVPANDTVTAAFGRSAAARQDSIDSAGSFWNVTYRSVVFVGGDDKGWLKGTNGSSDPRRAPYSWIDGSSDAFRLYVMPDTSERPNWQDVVICQLCNASYSVTFNFTFPRQDIQIRKVDYKKTMGVFSHSTDEDTFKNFLGKYVSEIKKDVVGPASRHLTYQAIMMAFVRPLVGDIQERTSAYGPEQVSFTMKSSTSREYTSIDWTRRDQVITGLAQLFQNTTISFMSDPSFIMNSTTAARVGVDVTNYNAVYSYRWQDLWTVYGISFTMTMLCVFIGTHAFIFNGASYQNRFSTFLRTTRDSVPVTLIDPLDDGSAPLPARIAKATVLFNPKRNVAFTEWGGLSSQEKGSCDKLCDSLALVK